MQTLVRSSLHIGCHEISPDNPDDAVAATEVRKYRKLMKLSRKNLIQKTCLAGYVI
jgi:hypothetical protein